MRVALITGGGSGVGRASAIALAADGFTIVVSGRRQGPLDETLALLGDGDHLAVVTDVTDPESVDALFAAVDARYGRLDLLFNNAGTGAPAIPIEELSFDQWQQVVATNLTGSFLCSQRAIAIMKRQTPQGGRIINNGSISAHTPRPNTAPYTATKHAITGLTKSIALDGRPFSITCGQIDIGNADTQMTDRMTGGVQQADGSIRPEPRMSTGDVARAVAYMASLPPDANVATMTVMAAAMPFIGRGPTANCQEFFTSDGRWTAKAETAYMSSQSPAVSLVVRLYTEPAGRGDLVGRAEVVSTGEIVAVNDADDLARIVTRVSATEPI